MKDQEMSQNEKKRDHNMTKGIIAKVRGGGEDKKVKTRELNGCE